MRAKRRRISSRCRRNAQECKVARYTLDTLPPEVLSIILRMLSLHDVACTFRLVSRRCSNIAATVLNSEFLVAGTKLEVAMKLVQSLMDNVKNDAESLLEYSRIFNALELIRSHYRMLKAVTWRYTHPRSQNLPTSCFYGGEILDNLNCLLNTILHPKTSSLFRNVDMRTLQLFTRSCEDFMDHFEKVTERRINRSALISGCKIVDILDCLLEGRQMLSLRTSPRADNPVISMQLRYVMKCAWFTCLKVPGASNEHCWRDKQRYMYLRLRRLVGSFNRHLFRKLHYELTAQTFPPRRPLISTYSGYGEYGGLFFYYGNMIKYTRPSNAENTGEQAVILEEQTNRLPWFDLIIEVQLRCSPELAPLAARTNPKADELEGCAADTRQELYLKLSTKCAASKSNRLPASFTWEVRGARANRSQCR